MAKKSIADELKNLRNAKRLSQQQVADLLGLPNKSTVGSWEIGKGSPDPSTLIKLCYIYGVGFEHFARECEIEVIPFEQDQMPTSQNKLPSDRQAFYDEVMKLSDEDFQMIYDIFQTVHNRTRGTQS